MQSRELVICELKGEVNSDPDLMSIYPSNITTYESYKPMISQFLPFGSKNGDFMESEVKDEKKYKILSYIFIIPHPDKRGDLVSISIVLEKKTNFEIYKPILKEIIDTLKNNDLLNEFILKTYLKLIYEGINEEKDILVETVSIPLSSLFLEVKAKYIKEKPNLKGSLF